MKRCSFIKYSKMPHKIVCLFDMSTLWRLETGAGVIYSSGQKAFCKCMLLSLLLFQPLITPAQTSSAKKIVVEKSEATFTRFLQPAVFSLSKIMMHDVVNPPAAARFHAYALLAGYEALCQLDTSAQPFQHRFKNYPTMGILKHQPNVQLELVVLYAILETGKNIRRKSGAKGMSYVDKLPEGKHQLRVMHPDYESQSRKFTILSHNATRLEMSMQGFGRLNQ